MPIRCWFTILMLLWLSFSQQPVSAGEPILLPANPAVSPDGDRIAFGYAGDVWTAEIGGGDAKRLTIHHRQDGQPVYSPDGKRLAFVSERTGSPQVYVMAAEGGQPRQITFHTEGCSLQDWSEDGSALLTLGSRDHHWRRSRRLMMVSAEKRSAERIVFDAYAEHGRWSPDGVRVLFVREGERWWRKGYHGTHAAQIWLYRIADETFEKLLDDPGGCRSPLWKPDGSGFYYIGAESGSFNLRAYDFETKQTQALTQFTDDSVVQPAISRDGTTIVFRHLFDLYRLRIEEQEKPVVIELQTDGDSAAEPIVRRSLSEADNATFSPDGLETAFIAGGDVWVMDTELREPVPITSTAVDEREPLFVEEGKSLLFLREEAGQVDLYRAKPKEPDEYWWRNSSFDITRLTNDAATEVNLQRSPDGKHIGFVKGRGDLWVTDLEGKHGKLITSGFDMPDYDFSPDGRWIAWSRADDDFNNEIWIAPMDGSREPFNVSRHPDNDEGPRWSPDGRKLAFVGRRSADEVDVYYVFLRAEDHDLSSRDRKLKQALEKLNKARKSKKTPTEKASADNPKDGKPDDSAKEDPEEDKDEDPSEAADDETTDDKPRKLPVVEIDFEGLPDRIRRISIADASEQGLFWFADGKTLAFQSRVDGKSGTYSVEIPERLTPKLISTKTGRFVRLLKDKKKIGWLEDEQPGTLTSAGKTESFSFKAAQEFDRRQRHRAAFDVAWRLMRDNWYDDRFNNRNWDAVRRKYADAAAAAPDRDAFTDVVHLMLGELNGSHLGFRPRSESASSPSSGWRPQTAHLGVRFDRRHKGPGLLVRDVIKDGPADKTTARIEPGDVILRIDSTTVDPDVDLTTILNGRLERDVTLGVRDEEGQERTLTLRPISYSGARQLLYPQFIEQTQQQVDKQSKETFGYLHIRAMNASSFLEFERQLYNAGYGKEGLIIDVRENGGGSTTDHLLTALTQPRHAVTVPRGGGPGYPHDRKVYATWHKPIVVLCNQNSFSNAEIFSHAIKSLGRGKLIGVTTAGGVISTGSARVMDLGTLRQPFRGWFVLPTGEDMEQHGAVPHHIVWPLPGELPAGKDRQLEKAIKVLKKDVRKWKKRQPPERRKASERVAED